MALGLIGRKIGMTNRFDSKGNVTPVTVIAAGPCSVVQKKTSTTDKYNAIQLGFEDKKETLVNKPIAGHFKKSNISPKRFLKEMRLDEQEIAQYKEGDVLNVDIFEKCSHVDIVGTTKGKGYAGVIKRHGFKSPKMTHGTHDCHRHGGSLGMRYPQHVAKGKKMAGHCGNERVTLQNVRLVEIKKEDNLILVEGGIPGANNGIVLIKFALRKNLKK